eukprot:3715211-Lingulodinium_polyedra.AAC.1
MPCPLGWTAGCLWPRMGGKSGNWFSWWSRPMKRPGATRLASLTLEQPSAALSAWATAPWRKGLSLT